MSRRALLVLSVLLAAPSGTAAAETTTSTVPTVRSPRVALTEFLELTARARFGEAAAYLELPADDPRSGPPQVTPERAAELARKLKIVLDHRLWIDLARVSPLPSGDVADGLPARQDELGQIMGLDGHQQPVTMVRRARWVFSADTVARIDGWYDTIAHSALLDLFPDALFRTGPRALAYWQWALMPVLLVAALILAVFLQRLTHAGLQRLVASTQVSWDDAVPGALRGPIIVGWTLLAFYLALPILAPTPPAEDLIDGVVRASALVLLFWTVSRVIDVAMQVGASSSWARTHPASRSLLPLGTRVAKVALGIVGLVMLLSELGYAVGSLLAGLGIGGLAVALAAQKTVENLIGAFAIGADQPFREGDYVKVEDFTGTVERIGLRSTRIRTADRTIISLPNGRLADMRLETYASRDRLRFSSQVRLAHDSTPAAVRTVRERIDQLLREHPQVWPQGISVRLTGIGEWSLTLEASAFFSTTDGDEFAAIREELLLAIMDIVAGAGTALAIPARAVQVAGEGRATAPGVGPPTNGAPH